MSEYGTHFVKIKKSLFYEALRAKKKLKLSNSGDYETDPSNIWRSEIFGRSLDVIVKEGIQAKLSVMPENTRFKLSQTVTKIVNKGSNNLIAIVI